MQGVHSYNGRNWHPNCADVDVVDVGGFAYWYCRECRVLARVESTSPRHKDWLESEKSLTLLDKVVSK